MNLYIYSAVYVNGVKVLVYCSRRLMVHFLFNSLFLKSRGMDG